MRVALVRRVEFVLATGLATPENARQLAVWWLILVSSPFVYYVVCKASLSLSLSGTFCVFVSMRSARLMMTTPKVTTTVFESTTDLRQSFVAALQKKREKGNPKQYVVCSSLLFFPLFAEYYA